jgi:hypothetical protein
MLPTKFRFIWPSGFRGEEFENQPIGNNVPVAAMFVNGSGRNEQSDRPTIDDTYQVSVHLAKRFQRRTFLEINQIRNKNCL